MFKSEHPLYGTWRAMIRRCHNPKDQAYVNYGGRGIKVCRRWRQSFWAFVEDVGKRPLGRQLDRINNDGDYEPDNVRWANRIEQRNNSRRYLKKACPRGHSYAEHGYQDHKKVWRCKQCRREKAS